MNNKVRNIDIEKLLFFDIETVRRNNVLELDSKEFELYSWSLRDKVTNELPHNEEVQEHYKTNGGLKPEFNKIVCISVGYVQGEVLYYKSLVGNQKDIVESFYNILNSTGLVPAGHNIIGFDMPTIRMKAFEEGVDMRLLPEKFNDVGKKPWDISDNFVDTMSIVKGTFYNNISLDSLCMLAGIESPKGDIKGSDVSRVYYEEGVDRIANYCNNDIIATAEVFCALQGRKGFLKSFVNKSGTEPTKPTVYNAISNRGSVTPEEYKYFIDTARCMNDKERDGMIKLIKAAIGKADKDLDKDELDLFNEIKSLDL
jgi:3'-5' exonuclease